MHVGRQQPGEAQPEGRGNREQGGLVLGQQEAGQRRGLGEGTPEQRLQAADPVGEPAPELARQERAAEQHRQHGGAALRCECRGRRRTPRYAAKAWPWARSSRRSRPSGRSWRGSAKVRRRARPLADRLRRRPETAAPRAEGAGRSRPAPAIETPTNSPNTSMVLRQPNSVMPAWNRIGHKAPDSD